jgi:hypothetical protein
MARSKSRTTSWRTAQRPAFDLARDELFAQITRCHVGDAAPEHQAPWFDDAMEYFREIHPALTRAELNQLRQAGERFAAPRR